MAEYINRERARFEAKRFFKNLYEIQEDLDELFCMLPAEDVVEVDKVAEMFYEAFVDACPCNYNDIDEWLPMLCGEDSFCGRHDDKFHCWKLFVKHYGEREGENA